MQEPERAEQANHRRCGTIISSSDYLCCFTDALKFRYIVMKNFEIAATGSLLLTDKAVEKEMNELGFVDHETCIFCERETFLEKADWILDPRNREAIGIPRRTGMRAC